MRSPRWFVVLGLLAVVSGPIAAAPAVPDGQWKVSYFSSGAQITYFIIKTETKDGKLTATLVASPQSGAGFDVEKATLEGDQLTLTLKWPRGNLIFAGRIKDDAKRIRGTMTQDDTVYPAELNVTSDTTLTQADIVVRGSVEPLQKALQLATRPAVLRGQASRTTEADKKADLLKQAKEAEEKNETELPKLYKEVLEKHADDPAVFQAVPSLLKLAGKSKATPEQVHAWAKAMLKVAENYGPQIERDVQAQIADALSGQEGMSNLALEYAQKAEKALTDKVPVAMQVRVLKGLGKVLKETGKTVELKEVETRLAKLEDVLDKEYQQKVPPFKPEAFAGRKGQNDRVVVMELFTGAQCPPCVAADVAFDALEKAYKPTDLVLIQYHMHIPGPDPLTNPDAIARWDYYRTKYRMEIGGTPSTLFDGKPQAPGGGGMGNAKSKFDQYTGIINPLLEKDTPVGAKLNATAARIGDKININVEVSDVAEPGEKTKLRLFLVEETIKYVGGNGLRFHHQVVRAMPGGADGIALKGKTGKQTVTVDLGDVRKSLTTYLDDYHAKTRPFPYADRPMDMKKLRVIAIVQNDDTLAIVQGIQVDVGGETAAK